MFHISLYVFRIAFVVFLALALGIGTAWIIYLEEYMNVYPAECSVSDNFLTIYLPTQINGNTIEKIPYPNYLPPWDLLSIQKYFPCYIDLCYLTSTFFIGGVGTVTCINNYSTGGTVNTGQLVFLEQPVISLAYPICTGLFLVLATASVISLCSHFFENPKPSK